MAFVPVAIDPAAVSDLAAEFATLDQDVHRAHKFAIESLRNPRPPEPTILWHYTNAEGLLGIIKGNELWMSHIATMNDSEEYLHGLQYILDEVDDRLSKTPLEVPKQFYQKVAEAVNSLMKIEKIPDIYVMSFSGETDTLMHWTEYGRHGVGYAIGFDAERLKAATANTSDPIRSPILLRCIYADNLKRSITAAVLDRYLEELLQTIASGSDTEGQIARFLQWFIFTAVLFGPSFKHAIFEPECEWRLVAFDRQAGSSVDYQARGNEVREIVKLSIGEGRNPAMSEIKIGSNRDKRLRKIGAEVIKRLLNAQELGHVIVAESMSPYRSP